MVQVASFSFTDLITIPHPPSSSSSALTSGVSNDTRQEFEGPAVYHPSYPPHISMYPYPYPPPPGLDQQHPEKPKQLPSKPIAISFSFTPFFQSQLKLDLSGRKSSELDALEGICKFFKKGHCAKGNSCPFKHSRLEKTVVCKHWLRGLCKKGELCEFLHEYNLKKMPECWFYSKYNECSNPECIYLHIDPNSKIKECEWYARGFCKHGPECRSKHVRRVLCLNYLTGFCPEGPNCALGHAKYELPLMEGGFYDPTGVRGGRTKRRRVGDGDEDDG